MPMTVFPFLMGIENRFTVNPVTGDLRGSLIYHLPARLFLMLSSYPMFPHLVPTPATAERILGLFSGVEMKMFSYILCFSTKEANMALARS